MFLFFQLLIGYFHLTRTNRDTVGQIGTLIAACQNIAYLVVTFGRE